MNILVVSDLAHTGFGRVGRELANGLLAKGHDIRVIAINYRGIDGELGAAAQYGLGSVKDAITERFAELTADPLIDRMVPAHLPFNGQSDGMGHALTNAAIHGQVWRGWHAEAAILVADPYAALLRLLGNAPVSCPQCGRLIPIYNYVPIEGTGLTSGWRMIWDHYRPVAMTDFGRVQLEELLGRPVPMIPHGASDRFYPVSFTEPGFYRGKAIHTKDAAKDCFGLRGKTVVLRIDRHIARKNYGAFFRVMRPIVQSNPDVVCVIHAAARDEYGNLHDLIAREPGAEQVIANSIVGWEHPQYVLTKAHDTYQGLSDADLNVLYNAADLLFSPTMAEGFGLTQAEAMAAGLPVVVTDYAASTEVVGPGGILVPPSAYVTNMYAHEWALIDEAKATEAVRTLIDKPALRRELGRKGRKHIAQFTWERTVDEFDRLLSTPAAVAA